MAATAVTAGVATLEVRRAIEERLRAEAREHAGHLRAPLAEVTRGTDSLARNRMLSNALTDSEGRAQYVVPFLRDVDATTPLPLDLVLCDFQGAAIAASSSAPRRGFVGEPWVAKVTTQNSPYAEVIGPPGRRELLLAFPIVYLETHSVEGLLVATLDLTDLMKVAEQEHQHDQDTASVRILDASGQVLVEDGLHQPWDDLLSISQPLTGPAPITSLGLRVQVGLPRTALSATLRSLGWLWALVLVLAAGAALLAARRLADWLTRPIVHLASEAGRIAESGRLDESLRVEGTDEITHLTQSFNQMLARLAATTAAQLAELREQNAELVRVHAEARRMEMELRQAQKLEAVGRLAAGIGHEINTPIQFIGDNTHFMKESFQACLTTLAAQREALERLAPPALLAELDQAAEALDLAYIREQAPRAIDRTLAGTRRVATIVRALKEFAHPDQKEMLATDLNKALQATIEISRNEYRYVADLETALGDLPLVTCHAGDVNQVFLNLIVNAAHAIADAVKGTSRRGLIRATTRREGGSVVISISDTGTGIPPEVADKIFEPFFTTKEVGRGTGQGLAVARSVLDQHQGAIWFETTPGQGTTFHVRLPVDGPRRPAEPEPEPPGQRPAPATPSSGAPP